jgi:hypothetical protein
MGNKPMDLEALRGILGDDRLWIALGLITRVELASDRSVCRVLVSILPEQREIMARMTWEDVGPDAGWVSLPSANDLVLVAMAEGDEESAYVIKRLSSKEDKIPVQAVDGDTAIVTKSGKKLWLTSATRINLSGSADQPTENLVLGQVFKELMADFLQAVAVHTHVSSAPGFITSPPTNATDFASLKASPVQDEAVLSALSFTE